MAQMEVRGGIYFEPRKKAEGTESTENGESRGKSGFTTEAQRHRERQKRGKQIHWRLWLLKGKSIHC